MASCPLRLGVLGCGRVFQRFHLPALARVPSLHLAAVCDPDPESLERASDRSPPPRSFRTPADLLRDPGLDAVLILTPPESHADTAIHSFEAGLHVLVEKPMALQSGDARRIAEAARRARRTLQVGFTRRFRAPYRRLRAALQQLDHNQPCAVSFELSFPGWDSRSGFLGDEPRGGGVLDDVLSHQVDLVCWLLGASPDQVRAVQNGVQGAGVTAELKFGSLIARCRAAHGSYVELLEVDLNDGGGLEATGSYLRRKGSRPAPWRRHRALFLDKLALARDRLLRRTNVTLGSFELQLRDFEHAVRGEHFDGATAEEGVRAVEIVQACRTSIRNGGVWQATMSPA